MKNNIDHYPHYVNSHNHWKFKTLRRTYKWEGEGKFWALNNMIGDSENCELDLNNPSRKAQVAVDLDFDIPELEAFISFLAEKCQLVIIDNGIVKTEKVMETFELVDNKRKKDRERKLSKSTTIPGNSAPKKENPSGVEPEFEHCKVKESKVKKSRVKKSSETAAPDGEEATASDQVSLSDYRLIEKDKKSIVLFIREKKPKFIEPYFDLWNLFAAEKGLPKLQSISDARKRKLRTRFSSEAFDFLAILKKASQAPRLLSGGWFTFDWLIENDNNFRKVLEGNYDRDFSSNTAVKTTPAVVQKPKSIHDEMNYFFDLYLNNELQDHHIDDLFFDKLVTRYDADPTLTDCMPGETIEEKKRAAVRAFFRQRAELKKQEVPA